MAAERRLSFSEEMERRTPGHKALSKIHHAAFSGGYRRFQGAPTEQELAIQSFRTQVLGNPEITKEDLVEFLAQKSVYDSIIQAYHNDQPSDD